MPQIFPKTANILPLMSLAGALFGGVFLIFIVWYYFSPEFTDVGYAPEQPVPYSHEIHVAKLGMDCRYCHTTVEVSKHANIPATQTCMNCHNMVRTDALTLLPVRESWATGAPIEWVNVHVLPDYAQFSHAVHVNNGVGCETCHGRVDRMPLVKQTAPLTMKWCIDCHRDPAPHLRPPEAVFAMGWSPPEGQRGALAAELARFYGAVSRTSCSECHR